MVPQVAYQFEITLRQGLRGLDEFLRTGDISSPILEQDLHDLNKFLGLNEPGRKKLQEMAPRTRRRYVAAAKKGDYRAKSTLKREQNMRTGRNNRYGVTSTQYTQLNALIRRIKSSGVDIMEHLEPETVKDMVQTYGFQYMIEVLTQQIDSIEEYTKGHKEPGNARWHARGELEEQARERLGQLMPEVFHISGTDPYYYYHGTLR